MKSQIVALLWVALIATSGQASAAIMSFSSTQPLTDTDDISVFSGTYLPSNPPNSQLYMWSDQPAQGQTFTTGSNPAGYLLNSFTFQQLTGTGSAGQQYHLRLFRPSGSGTIGTVLRTETATQPSALPNIPAGNPPFVTFTFDSPILLDPNTVYGFDSATNTPAAFGLGLRWAFLDTTYLGGSAISSGLNGTSSPTTFTANGFDRGFAVSLTAVPEPSTNSLFIVVGLVAFGTAYVFRGKLMRR